MDLPEGQDLTTLLEQWNQGDRAVLERLAPLVEGDLRRLAKHRMSGERPGHTLQVTALVNEVYLRLAGGSDRVVWRDRTHFFAFCAHVMRNILTDHARAGARAKRGGKAVRVTLNDNAAVSDDRDVDLIALDRALTRLESLDPQKCRIVELRFFAGLTVEETAGVVGVSEITVRREWVRAKAWLYRFLQEGEVDAT